MAESVAAVLALPSGHRVWLVVLWETGQIRKLLPDELTKLYGEVTHKEVYAVTDAYNNEVAIVPYQGDGIDLLLFEGSETKQGESK
jgi:hypothetical protein